MKQSFFASVCLLLAAAEAQQVFYPSLIIPIASDQPNQAFGTQTSGTIKWTQANAASTEIVFDNLPAGGTKCRLNFVLNKNGPWNLDVKSPQPWQFGIYNIIGGYVGQQDTWNKHPLVTNLVANVTLSAVGAQIRADVSEHTVPCAGGKAQYMLQSYPRPFTFSWFELNDVPAGNQNGITFVIQ
ncbi:hypothetical protein E6O75_ATG05933 [Venturia nashicola]|uniref:Ubiquitin 3 binding protein But2 C-terminal domain-containing protein n=1 Tax=Venturia nashicola TaxID=86259 RepID=A0A4Z1NRT5_9PEZI|nr:hypothetical protein E6O75_ATG05933 [Venturia nashicola]